MSESVDILLSTEFGFCFHTESVPPKETPWLVIAQRDETNVCLARPNVFLQTFTHKIKPHFLSLSPSLSLGTMASSLDIKIRLHSRDIFEGKTLEKLGLFKNI